mmetsp:Transcript_11736/g.35759  ORF Transcript_11736/g.35759 Transcript_11736/m.35759 type:complete len:270 (+) Transcript_11736:118-927(+)|eukprot:CAMPEP_0198732316 /NCGR_PEP_ID=MMETSP1475-20131203/35031_1 /TAXON_ID= ORGANISM="Unidentified sp., Strain CCMP1999" /NCGR_SAMPLE_ID=MMETSP1475 /ASSEMBLY_ACC=CAM_ASM_001111 /LENGTH=269 /DNA_ID=CAMNT_0044495391 /DNA_START=69 /DNA_END=878 /DNA_ORIENTATION=+
MPDMGGMYTPPTTMAALREYVTAPSLAQKQAAGVVSLGVTHSNLAAAFPEMRFELAMTVMELKDRLYACTGTLTAHMKLALKNGRGNLVCTMDDDCARIEAYNPRNGYTVHVIDTDPHSRSQGGWLENTLLVPKYEMSEQVYENRKGTFRSYKKDLVAKNANISEEKLAELEERRSQIAQGTKVGLRCEVNPGGKRGVVRYVGKPDTLPSGFWIGVELDEPVGKNDGCAKSVRLFSCPRGHGEFVRPEKVTVGDFPPLDDELDLSEDEL